MLDKQAERSQYMGGNQKYFDTLSVEDLFTGSVYLLMQAGETFIRILDSEQIFVGSVAEQIARQVDPFNSDKKLLRYMCLKNRGYAVSMSGQIKTVLIPMDLLRVAYDDFIRQSM